MLETATPATTDGSPDQEAPSTRRDSDPQLVLSDDVVIESEGPDHLVLANLEMATRVRVSRPLYRFVRVFRQPSRISSIVSRRAMQKLRPHLDLLRHKHILLDANAEDYRQQIRLRSNVAYRFCNCPAFDPKNPTDFTVVGLPCDADTDRDSRIAPEALRRKSLDFPFRRGIEDNLPCGWFDADAERWILEGVTLSDAGDIVIEHGETRDSLFKRASRVLSECRQGGSIPIILGGDWVATELAVQAIGGVQPAAIARLTEDGTIAVPEEGASTYLSIDLTIANAAYDDPDSSATAALALLSTLKQQIVALGRSNPIIAIDVVELDMRSGAGPLGAALGCQLVLTAMEAACASSRG